MKVLHFVHRLATGGLENGLINLINNLPDDMSHTIVSLTDIDDIRLRIVREDTRLIALDKQPGETLPILRKALAVLREECPDVVHTRNLGTLELQFCAKLAGIPRRIHSEHGWDTYDPDGSKVKYRLLRRVTSPLISQWIALSKELEVWLRDSVGIPSSKIRRICNGVDILRFQPKFSPISPGGLKFVTVTRLNAIKDPLNTLTAFLQACEIAQNQTLNSPTLTIVGDGPLMPQLKELVRKHKYGDRVSLVGQQLDISPYLNSADVFVLSSLREGISNTILEAMAAGLPVITTKVGGNIELVRHNVTGYLVPPGDTHALSQAMLYMLGLDAEAIRLMQSTTRETVEREYSLERMVRDYESVYRCGSTTKT